MFQESLRRLKLNQMVVKPPEPVVNLALDCTLAQLWRKGARRLSLVRGDEFREGIRIITRNFE